jgi:hypothetical protein
LFSVFWRQENMLASPGYCIPFFFLLVRPLFVRDLGSSIVRQNGGKGNNSLFWKKTQSCFYSSVTFLLPNFLCVPFYLLCLCLCLYSFVRISSIFDVALIHSMHFYCTIRPLYMNTRKDTRSALQLPNLLMLAQADFISHPW